MGVIDSIISITVLLEVALLIGLLLHIFVELM